VAATHGCATTAREKVFDEQADSFDMTDVTDCQLCTSVALPFLWQLASVVADVISVCVKLLVAAGKWQNSGRTPAAVVFSVMADVIPL
jgi:hypothetical protein